MNKSKSFVWDKKNILNTWQMLYICDGSGCGVDHTGGDDYRVFYFI
jgi:hypothetical protein